VQHPTQVLAELIQTYSTTHTYPEIVQSAHLCLLQGLAVVAVMCVTLDVVQQHVLKEDDGVVAADGLKRHTAGHTAAHGSQLQTETKT
jgi:hypothetical protein